MIGDFHFLRPAWLAVFLPAALLWWVARRQSDGVRSWRRLIAPHLLPHLLRGDDAARSRWPARLLGLGWLVGMVAAAGPAWRPEPAPFADDTAALAIVVKVTPSMRTEDVQPDRLRRSVQKIHDVLTARRGARTSLIAYAGTAHVVMPLTADDGIIDTFAQALDPGVMPVEGSAAADALRLADQTLREGGGSILWIADSTGADESPALRKWRNESGTQVRLLAPATAGTELESVRAAGQSIGADWIALTPDDADALEIARSANFAPIAGDKAGDRWRDEGYWLTFVIAALALPFFRKGWLLPSAQVS